MSPQLENGYTRIANEIMEILAKIGLAKTEMQVLLIVLRMTYGFGKIQIYIKHETLREKTGLNQNQISVAKSRLKQRKVIKTSDRDRNGEVYQFRKNITLEKSKLRGVSTISIKENLDNNKPRRIWKNFNLTPEMRNWFDKQGFKNIEIESATEEFVDYWLGIGKPMVDWVATWRNGMRNKEKWSQPKGDDDSWKIT